MAEEKIILANLDVRTNELLAKTEEVKTSIESLRVKQKELTDSGEQNSAQFIRNAVEIKRLGAEYKRNETLIQAQVSAGGKLESQQEAIKRSVEQLNVTENDYRANNTKLLKLRKELVIGSEGYEKALEDINKKLDSNNAFIKENVSGYEKQKIGIGSYKESIKEALSESGLLGKSMQSLTGGSESVAIGFEYGKKAADNIKNAFSEYKESVEAVKAAQENYAILQQIVTEKTEAASAAQEVATAIGFRYNQGLVAETELQAAATAATVANTEATEAQAAATAAGIVVTNASSTSLKLLKIALISTGIGAIVVVLGSLIAFLATTQEGIDAITSVTRPLQAIFSSLLGVFQNVGKKLSGIFTDPKKALIDFGNLIKDNIVNRFMGMLELFPKIGKAIGLLFSGEFSKAGQVATDAVAKVGLGVDGFTDKVIKGAKATGKFLEDAANKGKEIDRLTKDIERSQIALNKAQVGANDLIDEQLLISKDTSRSLKDRVAASNEIIRVNQEMGDKEAAIIEKKIARLKIEQSLRAVTNEDRQEMIDLEVELDAAQDMGLDAQKEQIRVIAAARKEANAAAETARKKALDDYTNKLKAELVIFKANADAKEKSMLSEMEVAAQVRDKKIEIAKAEFKANKDALALQAAENEAKKEYADASLDIVIRYGQAEMDLYIQQNQSKIKQGELLTDSLISEEAKRLDNIRTMQLKQLELEKKTNDTKIAEKQKNNQALSEADLQYLTAKAQIDREFNEQIKTNSDALEAQTKAKKVTQLEADKQLKLLNAKTEYDQQIINEQTRFDAELATLNEQLKQQDITREQYDNLKTAREKEHADNLKDINQAKENAVVAQYGDTFGKVAEILGKRTAAGKAAAIAEATINAYTGVSQVWASESILPEPFATAQKIVSTAVVLKSALSAVRSIQSTKTPKAEKGALFSIGGNRHSDGGTMFEGADGTRFEAERGELIGVMNRNAARHFMAFNNAFPAGGSTPVTNYLESGGMVSRNIQQGINIKELAYEIGAATAAANAISLPAPVIGIKQIISEGNTAARVMNDSTLI
ncbi:hypothetical protein Q765_03270 [Flavobacterium rivuli WB 3.3-2 = DSM 21788]|uniref:Uncharacterized protein n=1 Tax=Flavobacterium rivuli WB 3.3-2 = DSM 21788 TaxID=1121895 RepID=A0A0A2M9H9_9FLAO|nr:hypothetical protein [Flavobacterium rivuli]KGO88088.1 hypothetical protein Q765_03270 [Flavobacterium rivuli WB 3.3-2 = DSM 21788]